MLSIVTATIRGLISVVQNTLLCSNYVGVINQNQLIEITISDTISR